MRRSLTHPVHMIIPSKGMPRPALALILESGRKAGAGKYSLERRKI